MSKIDTKYKKIREKYGLPKLKHLEKEFDFELDEEKYILKNIFGKIMGKIEEMAVILEKSIFTSADPSKLYELKMAKENREELFKYYKKMMSFCWEGKKLMVISSDKAFAECINKVYSDWTKDSKQKIIELFELFEKEWQKVDIWNNNESLMHYG